VKLIILDRDGVINEDSDNYIKSPAEWIPVTGSLQAISRLNAAGYKVAVATNQSGIARGYYNLPMLERMHQKMHDLLAEQGGAIDYISYCPHGPDDECSCRKPKPGMLLEIMDHFGCSNKETVFVGDTLGDMKAASNANIPFVLVKTGKGIRTLDTGEVDLGKVSVYTNLADYVEWLLIKNINLSLGNPLKSSV
jgi:D-glycero-D-manno-heptose 1,7-bisphosphate phosphatase